MPDEAYPLPCTLNQGHSLAGSSRERGAPLTHDQSPSNVSRSVDRDKFASAMSTGSQPKPETGSTLPFSQNSGSMAGPSSSTAPAGVLTHSPDGGTSLTFKRTPRIRPTETSYFDFKPATRSPMSSPLSAIHTASRTAVTSDSESVHTFFTTRAPVRGGSSPGPQRPILTQQVAYAHAFAAPWKSFNLRQPPARSTPESDSVSGTSSQSDTASGDPSPAPADSPPAPSPTPPSNYSSFSHDRNPEPPRSFATYRQKPSRHRTKAERSAPASRDSENSVRSPATTSTSTKSSARSDPTDPTNVAPSLSELNAFGTRIMEHASIPPPSFIRRIDRVITGAEWTSSVTLVDSFPDDASIGVGSSVGGSSGGSNRGKGKKALHPRSESRSSMSSFMQSMKNDPSFNVRTQPLSPQPHKALLTSPTSPSHDRAAPITDTTKKRRSSRKKASGSSAGEPPSDPRHVPTFNTWVDADESDGTGALMRAQLESQLSKMLQRTRTERPTVSIGEERWAVGEERSPIDGEQDIILLNTSRPGKAGAVVVSPGLGAVVGVLGSAEGTTTSQGPKPEASSTIPERKPPYNPAKTRARGLRLLTTGTTSEPLGHILEPSGGVYDGGEAPRRGIE